MADTLENVADPLVLLITPTNTFNSPGIPAIVMQAKETCGKRQDNSMNFFTATEPLGSYFPPHRHRCCCCWYWRPAGGRWSSNMIRRPAEIPALSNDMPSRSFSETSFWGPCRSCPTSPPFCVKIAVPALTAFELEVASVCCPSWPIYRHQFQRIQFHPRFWMWEEWPILWWYRWIAYASSDGTIFMNHSFVFLCQHRADFCVLTQIVLCGKYQTIDHIDFGRSPLYWFGLRFQRNHCFLGHGL